MDTALEILRKKIQDGQKELLVLQFDVEETEKAYLLKHESIMKDFTKLQKDINETLQLLDEAMDKG
jgi:hypothetical protein